MVSVLLLAVLLGSVVAIVLMVYLIDRVKRLEVLSLQVTNNLAQAAAAPPASDNGFLGPQGKYSGMQCREICRKVLSKRISLH